VVQRRADPDDDVQEQIRLGTLNRMTQGANRGASIDYVLVSEGEPDEDDPDDSLLAKFVKTTDKIKAFFTTRMGHAQTQKTMMQKYHEREMKRADFEYHLLVHDRLKVERIKSRDGKYVYTLLHAPFKALLRKAEELRYLARLDPKFVRESTSLGDKFADFFKAKGGRDLSKRYDGAFAPDFTDRFIRRATCVLPRNAKNTAATLIKDAVVGDDVDCEADVLTQGFDKVTIAGGDGSGEVHYFNKRYDESLWPHQLRAMQTKEKNAFFFQAQITRSRVRRGVFQNVPTGDDHDDRHTDQNEAQFFTTAMRADLTWELIKGNQNEDGNGLEKLLHLGTYKCAFPLHDGELKLEKTEERRRRSLTLDEEAGAGLLTRPRQTDAPVSDATKRAQTPCPNESKLRTRAALFRVWGAVRSFWGRDGWNHLWRPSPFNAIRGYFGSKVALYFVFLDTYTTFLYVLVCPPVGEIGAHIIDFLAPFPSCHVCGVKRLPATPTRA